MHGKGCLVYPNGERYEGNWVYGKRHGCVCASAAAPWRRFAVRRVRARTAWCPHPPARLRCRFGSYYYLDGGRYEGEWVDDRIHGKGKSVYANGERAVGGRVGSAGAGNARGASSPRRPSPSPLAFWLQATSTTASGLTAASTATARSRTRTVRGRAGRARASRACAGAGVTPPPPPQATSTWASGWTAR